ncbi:hypothetical protein BSKO_11592 [Bryopsis sp. KO-2023]|nr:hypothetical protein BSKO_11592 [Bryopsis sp. KO-2023]
MNERDAEVISVYAGHCLVKCANVVLSSRIFSLNRIPPDERAKKWFSLAVEEVEPAVKELAQWRSDPRQPLAVEIFLRSNNCTASSEKDSAVEPDDVLLERWLLAYDASAPASSLAGSACLDGLDEVRMDKHSVYKKMVILTRSLYSYLRILPAYRLYRAGQNAESRTYDLIYRLSSGEIPSLPIEDSGVQFNHFSFSDLATPSGSLSVQVHYRPSSTIGVLEETTQTQALPRIISDYINTPRQLQSLSASVHKAPVVASAGLSPSGTHGGAQPPMLHRNSWSSKDVPNLLPLPTPYSATSSQIAASPKPTTLNGQRHIPGRNPIRTTSAPVPRENKRPSAGSPTKSRSFGGRECSTNYRYTPQCPKVVREGVETSIVDDQGRKVSAPVTIPGHRAHRGGSFPDLSAATVVGVDEGFQILESSCVASAPANVPPFNGIPRSPRIPKDTPPMQLAVSCSDSSFSSAFPQSCSPQLPFAFTPSGPSSSGDQAGFGSGASNLSPPISGRDISALAVIRRPSWSSRSFDMNNPRFSDPSEPWLSQCSQPVAGFCIPLSGPPENLVRLSPSSRLLQSGGSDGKSGSILQQSDVFHSCVDSSESDLLPFALDGEEGSSSQSDAAVVSFLRLMQDAPPLTSPGTSPSMSVERAREQLREFKVKVEGFKLGKLSPRE